MKKFFAPALALFVASVFFIDPALAQLILPTDNPDQISSSTAWDGSLRQMINTTINAVLFFLGIICVIFIIYAGFLYITSQGDEQNTDKAKNILMYAVIGILIILVSYALVNTIFESLQTGTRTA